jgi:hypothetical protein
MRYIIPSIPRYAASKLHLANKRPIMAAVADTVLEDTVTAELLILHAVPHRYSVPLGEIKFCDFAALYR